MRTVFRIITIIFAVGILFALDGSYVLAATSQVEFAMPVETKRMSYSLALIRRDNSIAVFPMEKEVRRATVSPDGSRIAYVIRDGDHLQVFIMTPDGKNKKLAEDYRSDERNFQDFVDIKFVKNGKFLLITRFLKNQLGFVEYNLASGKPRFLKKSEWQGAPTTVYRTDSYGNGCLVFERSNNEGNRVIQQIWTAGAYDGVYSLFLELESPPSILDMVPDLSRKRIFASGTPTRHASARNTTKNLFLITSSKEDPKELAKDTLFVNLTISNDGNSVIWQDSLFSNGIKFRKYDIKSDKVIDIIPEGQNSGEASGTSQVGTVKPAK